MVSTLSRRRFILSGAFAAASAAQKTQEELSFIQVTDTHVSVRPLVSERLGYNVSAQESVRRCTAVVRDINHSTLPHDFVIHTGDVAHGRETPDDFDMARELLRFRKAAYYVPGNHDLGYSQTAKYRPAFEKRFGPASQAFQPIRNVRITLFDSLPLDFRASEADRKEAFAGLERVLTPRMPTILCCHVTGVASFHSGRFHEAWPPETMLQWVGSLKAGGVFAVIAGHFHRDELHVVHGVPFYHAGPVINFWGRQTSYRHWTLAGGALSYRTVYLDLGTEDQPRALAIRRPPQGVSDG